MVRSFRFCSAVDQSVCDDIAKLNSLDKSLEKVNKHTILKFAGDSHPIAWLRAHRALYFKSFHSKLPSTGQFHRPSPSLKTSFFFSFFSCHFQIESCSRFAWRLRASPDRAVPEKTLIAPLRCGPKKYSLQSNSTKQIGSGSVDHHLFFFFPCIFFISISFGCFLQAGSAPPKGLHRSLFFFFSLSYSGQLTKAQVYEKEEYDEEKTWLYLVFILIYKHDRFRRVRIWRRWAWRILRSRWTLSRRTVH